jgi:hypothetical protein
VFGEGNLSALEDVEERPSQPGGAGPGSVGTTGPHAAMQHSALGMGAAPPSVPPPNRTGGHPQPPKSGAGGAGGGSGAAIGVVLLLVAAAAAGAAWFTGLIPHH